MVQVACFGVSIIGTAQVHSAEAFHHFLNLRSAAIIENVNRLVAVIDSLCADDSPANDIYGFVIRRNKNVDGRKHFGSVWSALLHFNRLEVTQEQNNEPVDLGEQQN